MRAPLTELQRDALCELANVGAGHGAAALASLLAGERFGFWPPGAREATPAELSALLGGDDAPRVVARVELTGELVGALWLVLTPEDAELLASRLTGQTRPGVPEADQVLGQAARAVASAAIQAMGQLTGLSLEGGPPVIHRTRGAELARALAGEAPLVLDAQLRAPRFSAQLLLLPASATLDRLLRAMRV